MTSSFLSDTLGIPWNGGSVLPGSMPTMGQGGSYFSHNTAVIPYPTNSINTFTGGGKRTRRIRKANKRTLRKRKAIKRTLHKCKANKRTLHKRKANKRSSDKRKHRKVL